MTATDYRLTDRFTADRGTVFLSGIQALARLPIEQLRADRRAGLRTAALVSGYPGSPLGGFDVTVASAAKLAPDLPIVCRPAVNEEYAATRGDGLAARRRAARPPLRRRRSASGTARRPASTAPPTRCATRCTRAPRCTAARSRSWATTRPRRARRCRRRRRACSRTCTCRCSIPAIPPRSLDLGRHAVAMSRVTGLWTALKIVADVADATAIGAPRPGARSCR